MTISVFDFASASFSITLFFNEARRGTPPCTNRVSFIALWCCRLPAGGFFTKHPSVIAYGMSTQ